VQLGNGSESDAGWAVQAAMSEGDVSSWIVAGSFSARGPRAHAFDMGLSYGAQEYAGGNPAMLAVRSDGSRRVGGVYGFDNWSVSPRVHLTYGARVARYDYVDRQDLWSPRAALSFNVADGTHVRAAVSQRMRAPGAEEFLPPQTGGPWIPPERTFSPIAGDEFRVERIRQLEVSFEREFQGSAVVSFRRFVEKVDDQLVTVFGAQAYGAPRSDVGHYLVGSAGAVDAEGWGVKVASSSTRRLRGSVDYTLTRARWAPDAVAAERVLRLSPSAIRTDREDIHDVAMSGEADILETATRVFFYYRVSTGYARDDEAPKPAVGGRFDLQVRQGLPFIPLRGSEWQVLLGIRDLFRDPLESSSSVYDELLVVRPPKRVIGGVQVKF
jgi:outer membrane receptor protein involved in Fe transport